jgi:hypothetical protein
MSDAQRVLSTQEIATLPAGDDKLGSASVVPPCPAEVRGSPGLHPVGSAGLLHSSVWC